MKRLFLLIVCFFGEICIFADNSIPACTVAKNETLSVIAQRFYNQYAKDKGYENLSQYVDSLANWNKLSKDSAGNPIIRENQSLYLVNPQNYIKELDNTNNQKEEVGLGKKQVEETMNVSENSQSLSGGTQSKSVGRGQEGGGAGNQNDSKHDLWVWMFIGLLAGIVVGIFLFYVLYVKKVVEEHEYRNAELSRKYHNLSGKKSSDNPELSRLRSKIQTLEREKQNLLNENISLGGEIDRLKAVTSQASENRPKEVSIVSSNQVSSHSPEQPTTLYADAIIDGFFVKVRETPSEDSIFVLHIDGKDSAVFDIYTNAYSKIVANPSYLEGCEKQILYDTRQIEIVSKGSAQQVGVNGKWKVLNKLNVIIK